MRLVSACLFVLFIVASIDESDETDEQLIGQPDGHEPYDRRLIGQPDGHDFDVQKESDSSPDSSSEEHGSEDDESSDTDAEQPLVRCKRPICAMYCENGFVKDSTGCPICQCLGTTERPLIGRPDGHEMLPQDERAPAPHCADRPMCRMYCAFGFKRDADGCEVCSCLSDPCLDTRCGPGLECKRLPCDNLRSCNKLTAKCVATSTRPPCLGPEPMCANYCPDGYRYNENGCMTCDCVVTELRPAARRTRPRCRGPMPMCAHPCPGGYKYKPDGCMTCECEELPDNCLGSEPCKEGQVCRKRTIEGVMKPVCTVKTLCEMEHQPPRVQCEEDGSFKPMQCTLDKAQCWCVGADGKELAGTRTVGNKPNCVRNVTVSMHIHMLMVVEHHIDITKLDSLHSLIVDHVSSWLVIEPHYITVVKTEAQNSDDDMEGEARLVVVELTVVHDGVTDLPSAGKHMKDRMHRGQCRIPVEGGGALHPDPHSMRIHHNFAMMTTTTPYIFGDGGLTPPGHRRGGAVLRLAFCAVAALIFVLIIISAVGAVVQRRRNKLAAQFKHQKLESPTIAEKNLLTNDYVPDLVAVTTKDDVKEKEPIA